MHYTGIPGQWESCVFSELDSFDKLLHPSIIHN